MSDSYIDKSVKLGIVFPILTEYVNKKLFGEILTIMDASISTIESRKAVRSLISQAFSRNTEQVRSKLDEIGGY